jgi:hypothetical protein
MLIYINISYFNYTTHDFSVIMVSFLSTRQKTNDVRASPAPGPKSAPISIQAPILPAQFFIPALICRGLRNPSLPPRVATLRPPTPPRGHHCGRHQEKQRHHCCRHRQKPPPIHAIADGRSSTCVGSTPMDHGQAELATRRTTARHAGGSSATSRRSASSQSLLLWSRNRQSLLLRGCFSQGGKRKAVGPDAKPWFHGRDP